VLVWTAIAHDEPAEGPYGKTLNTRCWRVKSRLFPQVIRHLTCQLPIGPDRIYSTGQSYGSGWGGQLAFYRPDLYAGFVGFPGGGPREEDRGNAAGLVTVHAVGAEDDWARPLSYHVYKTGDSAQPGRTAHPDSRWFKAEGKDHFTVWDNAPGYFKYTMQFRRGGERTGQARGERG